jgi:dihydroorotate dehydrogenase electron transfer subunit
MTSTDDGTQGHKGYNTEILADLLKNASAGKFAKPDGIYTCGPEKMMFKVAQMAQDHNVFCEVSLERYMKCGFGACGQCCMDGTGIRICKEGPVVGGLTALKLEEFGKYTRDSAGVIKNL